MKFKVQAQTLIELEIEAVDQDAAEEKIFDRILDEEFRLNDMNWSISSYPIDENGRNIEDQLREERQKKKIDTKLEYWEDV